MKNPAEYSEVERVICSPMLRCIQTAELMFPGTERKTEPRLRECDFGQFEGKTYEELKSVPKYIAWLKSNGTIPFPGGEEQSVFRRRSVEGAIEQIEWLIEKKVQRAAFVVHGGTIMAVFEQLAEEKKNFYDWQVGNGSGYRVIIDEKSGKPVIKAAEGGKVMGLVSLGACVAGFVLDFIFGDPVWLYHPVRLIGKWISFLEKLLRRKTGEKRQIAAGGILWILTVAVVYSVTAGILWIVRKWGPAAGFILETFWCYQIFAARCLVSESGKVYERLKEKDLPGSRKAVSMIVGRDTENLSFEGVTKAAVETVAENTSDGVTAPLLYLLLGGAPLGFLYKAVNTMDSMLGYKNETYLYFGRIPAKMDDLFNYIPARLTAWFMVLASFLTGLNGKNAWKIYRRDCRKHASPNSAQSEAVCAGALDVQLAGDAVYFGKIHKKEFIGDPLRKIEAEDIPRAGRLMYVTTVLMLLVFGGIKLLICLL